MMMHGCHAVECHQSLCKVLPSIALTCGTEVTHASYLYGRYVNTIFGVMTLLPVPITESQVWPCQSVSIYQCLVRFD